MSNFSNKDMSVSAIKARLNADAGENKLVAGNFSVCPILFPDIASWPEPVGTDFGGHVGMGSPDRAYRGIPITEMTGVIAGFMPALSEDKNTILMDVSVAADSDTVDIHIIAHRDAVPTYPGIYSEWWPFLTAYMKAYRDNCVEAGGTSVLRLNCDQNGHFWNTESIELDFRPYIE